MPDTPQPTPVSFSEFEPLTTAAWQERIRRDLKGADLASLEWHTPEGFTVQPFYHREALENLGQQPVPQAQGAPTWLNVPTYHVPAADHGHTLIDQAADALARGADGVYFVLADAATFDVTYLSARLPLATTYIGYSLKSAGLDLVQRLLATGATTLRGFLQYDPITNHTPNLASQLSELRQVLRLTRAMPQFRGLSLHIDNFGNCGATATQQLAFALSTAAAYLSELSDAELSVVDVAATMQVHVAINPSYFIELTKLRALRRLWATLLHAYQLPPAGAASLTIFASTASWSKTTLDSHTNLLRVTTETMAAVLGGADAVSVGTFDSLYEAPNEFSARIARNLPIILREESGLNRVADPAAGSYYLETLTDELAREAWSLFQRIQAAGGLPSATRLVVQELHEAAQAQFRRIAAGEQVVVGTNRFQNAQEQFSFNPKRLLRSKEFDTTRATYPSEVLRLATVMHFQRRERRRKRAAVVLLGPHTNQHIMESFMRTLPKEERPELAAAHPVGTLSVLFSSPEEATLMYATPEQFNAFARTICRVDPEDPSFAAPTLLSADLATLQEAVQFFGFQEFTVNGYSTEEVLARLQGK
ncbi:methylmalonyl-CoA mutase family protein [Hymenobacter cavernae]|uniref:Methylmalonyl-CoA mutase alpha/beta chain catalytic domain-containing protein n=1 Tax=Hymenobacter cavernae TaxID=2044852 RepID=A0ABQ1TK16_9BACT|nr:methylmalonyl-CoA mutase family protein [Hymenobacter cavernae]GGE95179.1 hypothetical protein GCM10011383_02330 [Hymenobacter cavernae]